MDIQSLTLRGFRSLRDVTWAPGRLNVLIGSNGSGKSNLLRAMELLHIAADGKLSAAVISQGGINALLWDGREDRISWELALSTEEQPLIYSLELRPHEGSGSFRVEQEILKQGDLLHMGLAPGQRWVAFDPRVGSNDYVEEAPKDQTALVWAQWISSKTQQLTTFLSDWSIYQDIHVDQAAPLRQAAVARFEKRIDPDGQNLIPVLHTLYTGEREFKRSVDEAMRAAFGSDYEELVFPPAADQRVQLRIRWRSLKTEQSAASLSDGTLRFLLLLAILANPEPGSLIAIDEPETGLHPSMFPLIAELATDAAERTQVILTTHSPQFLDAFSGEPPTTTIASLVDGETRLSVVDGEELRRWLREYSLGALFRSGELEALA